MNKEELIHAILLKRELKGISFDFVNSELSNFIAKNKINLSLLKERQLRVLVKEIRSLLRNRIGMFSASQKNRSRLIESNEINALLKTHSSTKERINIYPWLKEKILSLNPSSILDLACGLNPLAIADKKSFYYASDINRQDISIVKEYFRKNKILGKVFIYDIKKIDSTIPKADLTLILKTLDILRKSSYLIAKKIISTIKSKNIIVSFSTRTLSGKIMKHSQREWFEKILKEENLEYYTEEKENEIFYFIKKNFKAV